MTENQSKQIKFKDLSLVLKIGIVGGLAYVVFWILAIIALTV
ncbi:MAG: hypothetical protein ACOCRX_04155 [Candidatus Woesearchaeota archaeon]